MKILSKALNLKNMVDAELLERKIIEEIWKPKEKELSRGKSNENTK